MGVFIGMGNRTCEPAVCQYYLFESASVSTAKKLPALEDGLPLFQKSLHAFDPVFRTKTKRETFGFYVQAGP